MGDRPKQEPSDAVIRRPAKVPADEWSTKIAIAKQARSEALKARKGKPATFADRVVVNSTRR
jgi:hypothetical protein